MESDKEQARWLIKCVSDGRMTGGMAAEIEDYCFARRTELEKLTAERDQLQAEVERLRGEISDWKDHLAIEVDRSAAAEFTVAGLRRALEEIKVRLACGQNEGAMAILGLALTASPDEHERRLKVEALRATASELEKLREHIQEYIGPDDARDDIRRICWNRAKDLREETDRLEAANG